MGYITEMRWSNTDNCDLKDYGHCLPHNQSPITRQQKNKVSKLHYLPICLYLIIYLLSD